MEIKFEYKPEETACVFKARGVDVLIKFDDLFEVSWVEVNDTEYLPLDDTLYYLFVQNDGDFVRISHIINRAKDAIEGLHKEALEDEAAENEMHKELSSPQATGRV